MNKKLTLSVDDSVITRAKEYAKENRESLSHLVENYFRLITAESQVKSEATNPLVGELMGSLEVPDDFDYDRDKLEYLENKYLNG